MHTPISQVELTDDPEKKARKCSMCIVRVISSGEQQFVQNSPHLFSKYNPLYNYIHRMNIAAYVPRQIHTRTQRTHIIHTHKHTHTYTHMYIHVERRRLSISLIHVGLNGDCLHFRGHVTLLR